MGDIVDVLEAWKRMEGGMAIEDHPKFNEWEKAWRKLEIRTRFLNEVCKKWDDADNPLRKQAQKAFIEAQAEYDKIWNEIT
jgi:hypothetical protein